MTVTFGDEESPKDPHWGQNKDVKKKARALYIWMCQGHGAWGSGKEPRCPEMVPTSNNQGLLCRQLAFLLAEL